MNAGTVPDDAEEPRLPWLSPAVEAPVSAALSPEEQRALDDAAAELTRQNEALRQHQRELEGALERFATLFSSVPLPLLVIDTDGLVLESNAKALDLLRPRETDPPINFLLPFVAAASQGSTRDAMAHACENGHATTGAVTLMRPAGPLPCELHFSRLDQPDAPQGDSISLTQLVCAVVDQTPVIQLRQSQKMQAVGTLAGGIAHDFNNILAAVLGNAELALQAMAAPEQAPSSPSRWPNEVRTCLTQIEQAAMRGRALVQQILAFSRREALSLSPIALSDVVLETQALIRLALPPHVAVQLDVPEGLPPALADRTQAAQALLNLCTNAIQAIANHAPALTGQLLIRLRLDTEADHLRLSVRDNGPGISLADQERVFEPFFTTKSVGQGTGLGLAVVHGIMGAHGGAVELWSEPGQGCEFTLVFQAAPAVPGELDDAPPLAPAAQATHSPVASTPVAPNDAAHILVVDDDQALVFLLERALRGQGHRVTSASSAAEALGLLRQPGLVFNLVLTDHNMPGTSGLELLRQIRALNPALPVALMSGYISTDLEVQAIASGAAALIPKPSSAQETAQAIQRLLH